MALLLAGGGCVSLDAHRQLTGQRDALSRQNSQLQEKVRRLEVSNESLDDERVQLMEETENLREIRRNLERDVGRLRQTEIELTDHLAAREIEVDELHELRGTYEGLVADLESEVASGQIEIEQLREGVRLKVSDEILFDSGSAELGREGTALLTKVAGQLHDIPNRVEVQGHTDDVAIVGVLAKTFPTNWELAGARAARVARLFQQQGVDPERLTAVSYGPYRPIALNDTPEDRALNRRIEIRLLPSDSGETLELPEPAPAAP